MKLALPFIAMALSIGPLLAAPVVEKHNLGGFLHVPMEPVPEEYDAGFSQYMAVWPLVETHPGNRYQSGLFGTWLRAQNDGNPLTAIGSDKEGGVGYSTIEGGCGVWRSNRFPTVTPKFQMGGVAINFKSIANGPGMGKGKDWNKSEGRYGVAQISPWVVMPMDGLNFKQGSCGELFGYGYHPLPLLEPKARTAGRDFPTGGQCWTLFVNTKTFKGPLAFFTPYFWTQDVVDRPELAGKYFDTRPSKPNRPVSMETQYIPARKARDKTGTLYARLAQIDFPRNLNRGSVVTHRYSNYSKAALWDDVKAWFGGGPAASGRFKPEGTYLNIIKPTPGGLGWTFFGKDADGNKQKEGIGLAAVMTGQRFDEHTYGFRWNEAFVEFDDKRPVVKLPVYYRFDTRGGKSAKWVPVNAADVPPETGLLQLTAEDFYDGPNKSEPYATPDEPESVWKRPGPAAGPFAVELGDGSTLTYCWYRFRDQPSLQHADLNDEELDALQQKIEMIHRRWTKERDYIAPPSMGELVELDPALLVAPPAGMEIGYVPIATHQAFMAKENKR